MYRYAFCTVSEQIIIPLHKYFDVLVPQFALAWTAFMCTLFLSVHYYSAKCANFLQRKILSVFCFYQSQFQFRIS
jgi:hypothetical protein